MELLSVFPCPGVRCSATQFARHFSSPPPEGYSPREFVWLCPTALNPRTLCPSIGMHLSQSARHSPREGRKRFAAAAGISPEVFISRATKAHRLGLVRKTSYLTFPLNQSPSRVPNLKCGEGKGYSRRGRPRTKDVPRKRKRRKNSPIV